tara:strand:+ start:2188 stop:3351 length:1164 start_codon:yes stop_codon:yes gene_type:complete
MKTHSYFIHAILIALLIYYPNCYSQSHSESDLTSAQIDDLVSRYFTAQKFSGTVLVAEKGNVIINKEYGYGSLDSLKKINSESVFEIASLSKQFTGLLMMMLKEEGKLEYDDMVTKFLPQFPYDKISIRHLLTHTSGLSERKFFRWAGKNMDSSKTYTNAFILNYLLQQNPQLSFHPGEKWEYSNLGYFILPLIIKEITGQDYIKFLKDKILIPLEMNNTGIFSQDVKANKMENYVLGKIFNPKDSIFISSFGMAKSDSIYGSVGLLSNANDLLKWDRALYTNKLIDQKTMQEAFTPYVLADGTSSNYGFGWFIEENLIFEGVNSGKRLNHYGLWPGYETSIVRYIDKEVTIILLANQSPSVKDKLVEEISQIFFRHSQQTENKGLD